MIQLILKIFIILSSPHLFSDETNPQSQIIFYQSLGYYNENKNDKALEGFMSVLTMDPDNNEAKEYLDKTINRLLAEEKEKATRTAEEIFREATRIKEELDLMLFEKNKIKKGWKEMSYETSDYIIKEKDINKCLVKYYDFLSKSPVFSDFENEFKDVIKEPQKKLVEKLNKNLGLNIFSLKDIKSVEVSKDISDEIEKILRMENQITILIQISNKAYLSYTQEKYFESEKLFKKIIEVDSTNPEAQFYIKRINERLSSIRGGRFFKILTE
ncbi:MAG: hypothetical protein KA059_06810 [Elusimicrobiales bacterium]|nr:hypothetical protein [Elusimicrobiales bacterium]